MNVGISTGLPASIAGVPAAQIAGSDSDRTKAETGAQHRAQFAADKAEAAAGIGVADGEDHATADRDADGRRMWEFHAKANQAAPDAATTEPPTEHRGLDPTGTRGGLLDLSG